METVAITTTGTAGNPQPVESVREFWNTEACGSHFVRNFADDRDFFSRYRQFRYSTEWHIPEFAAFADAAGRQVLEIGCGNGADGAMFALHGARYTGVDLTAEAVDKTRRHFSAEGLDGAFRQENCEQLSFADNTFDVVYSFGVLHHTPAPEQAFREVHRVLKPGGEARLMLYHRHSFNYYVRILGYMRARAVLEVVRRAGRWQHDRQRNAGGIAGVRGNDSPAVWDIHYRNFLREGWGYFRPRNFVHRCTDGPECPYAFTYTAREARRLFAAFGEVTTSVGHLPLNKYPGARLLPRTVERLLARTMGWHLLIRARKAL
jgi:2-polyprenyl-3-methyl-5-hydroxy-6-metoxy-1,4-benzoquinol methylase